MRSPIARVPMTPWKSFCPCGSRPRPLPHELPQAPATHSCRGVPGLQLLQAHPNKYLGGDNGSVGEVLVLKTQDAEFNL